jgi:hypothetical protein
MEFTKGEKVIVTDWNKQVPLYSAFDWESEIKEEEHFVLHDYKNQDYRVLEVRQRALGDYVYLLGSENCIVQVIEKGLKKKEDE